MSDLVDSHCHIQDEEDFPVSATEIVAAARAAGVTKIICAGTSVENSRWTVDFCARHDGCFALVGVHPEEKLEKLTELAGLLNAPRVVGVGEIGLDYHYGGTDKTAQQEALKYQLNLAAEHNLPVSFHVREAFADFWPIFDAVHQQKPVRGVLHCFTGTRQDLAEGLRRGLYISLNGIVTFNKDPELNEVFKTVPLDRVLLETDAPYLTPVPYRGSVNQPAYVREIAEAFAELRGVSVAEIEKITTQNIKDLFLI